MNECRVTGGSVVHELVVATLSHKDLCIKEDTVMFSQRMNNNLVKASFSICSTEKGFHLVVTVREAIPCESYASCGEYLHRLNKMLANDGALGFFVLDHEQGVMTYEANFKSFGMVNSRIVRGYVDDGILQVSRFGNLLQASALGEDPAVLAYQSVAPFQL